MVSVMLVCGNSLVVFVMLVCSICDAGMWCNSLLVSVMLVCGVNDVQFIIGDEDWEMILLLR